MSHLCSGSTYEDVYPHLCLSVLVTPNNYACFTQLTFWRRIFFLILAHPVFKMSVTQKPNKVAL